MGRDQGALRPARLRRAAGARRRTPIASTLRAPRTVRALIITTYADDLRAALEPQLPAIADGTGCRIELLAARGPSQIPADVSDVDVLLAFHLPGGLVERMPRLRWVASPGAGVDRVLRPELPPAVRVTRTLGVFGRPLAEYVLGAILADTQRHAEAWALQRAHRFAPFRPAEISERTAAIVGAGVIGQEIARLLTAAGMRAIGLRRGGEPHPAFERMFGPDALLECVALADYVVLVLPLTRETRGLIGRDVLRAMRRDALLVNVARGAVVDEDALAEELRLGTIAGAVLDVFTVEPLPAQSPLWDLPTVRITPHVAGLSRVPRVVEQFAANLRRYLTGEPLAGEVDRARGY